MFDARKVRTKPRIDDFVEHGATAPGWTRSAARPCRQQGDTTVDAASEGAAPSPQSASKHRSRHLRHLLVRFTLTLLRE